MRHKVTRVSLMDEVSPTAKIAGACNATLRRPDGTLLGDMFDGAGALVVGCGGVGCAIAASLAAAGIAAIGLFDANAASAEGLADRLRGHYPALEVGAASDDPAGYELVVNATPMGMNDGDPLPMDVSRIAPSTFVGEVVMWQEVTAFLRAVQARGCLFQSGSDMLFEQLPAYLECFGFPTPPKVLRSVARLIY